MIRTKFRLLSFKYFFLKGPVVVQDTILSLHDSKHCKKKTRKKTTQARSFHCYARIIIKRDI